MKHLGRPPSNRYGEPTNKRILTTASRLFLERSYQEVSMDDVADACDVTKATIYYYYKTKPQLYTESMIGLLNRVRDQINLLLDEEVSLYDRLTNIANAYLNVASELDMDRFMHSAKNSLAEGQIRAIQQAEESMYKGIEDKISEASARNEIHAENPAFVTRAYIALLKIGHYRNVNGESVFHVKEDAAREIMDFFWRSISK